jgi:alkylation response protein AidB-like acyl-CoA dehydrogenase
MQHHNAVGILTALAPEDVADRWLADLCGGRVRAGVAFAGLRRPGAPLTRVARTAGGFVLSGSAPWVTGWGIVDVVHTAARDEVGDVHWLLVDAVAGETLRVEQHDLIAAGASGTVTVSFADHPVPSDRLTHVESFEEWRRRDARGLGRNGSLALGVATRATELLGDPPELLEEISSRRDELARADADEVPAARARASLLALDATTRLFVAGGGRSTIRGGDAERLVREALFLQVFGQTPAIKDEQLRLLTAGGSGAAWPRPNV